MKRALASLAVVAAIAVVIVLTVTSGSSASGGTPTYKIEMDNAFGLVTGADLKVAGVRAGKIEKIELDQKSLHAVVTVQVTQTGFGTFHRDGLSCESRPQSLIGEYFIDCQPGTQGPTLPSGATIPVTDTHSTIPADLLQNVMRLPYRERLSLIVGELGAAVAGRSGDLQAALRRAVPALDQTDNLLTLLANDSHTLQQLTANSNTVITALANNSATVNRFIAEAGRAASDTATQDTNLQSTFQKLPGFLEQLRPALAKLGAATVANDPVLANLQSSAGQLNRLFTDLTPFSRASLPALRALGKASVIGRTAVKAATPTIRHLNTFATHVPELAKNLSIVLPALDDRSKAVETNPRSPGGQGYTGLEALLQFAFNLAAATNTFGPFGHQLAVDAFVSAMCTPYATPATIQSNLAAFGSAYRNCYAWLGPNQPGVNQTDPSNATACVPDPGGAPPGLTGPSTSACKGIPSKIASAARGRGTTTTSPGATPNTTTPPSTASSPPGAVPASGTTTSGSGSGSGGGSGANAAAASGQGGNSQGGSGGSSSTQQLLNYLISP